MSEMIEQVQESAAPKRVVMRPDGYKEVRIQEDGKEAFFELQDEKFTVLPKKFRPKHFSALRYIWGFGLTLVARSQRELPIMREELEASGIEKNTLKQLEDFGFVHLPLIPLSRQGGGPIGSRVAVVITPKGQGLINHVMGAIEGEMASDPAQAAQEAPAEVVAVEPVAVVAAEVVDGN